MEAFFDNKTKTFNLVMESANDGNLGNKINSIIKKGLHMEECTIWEVLTQILHGLNYLYTQKIVHRNLKSSSIYLTKTHLIKITDFYSCCILNDLDCCSNNNYSISLYTAPELLNKNKNH